MQNYGKYQFVCFESGVSIRLNELLPIDLCLFNLNRMGDHVSGPSLIKATGESISKIIASDNSSIGGATSLPFLFKVLSVTKPLSIQVHPNKVNTFA